MVIDEYNLQLFHTGTVEEAHMHVRTPLAASYSVMNCSAGLQQCSGYNWDTVVCIGIGFNLQLGM